jgi:hypothetical protein
MSGLEAGSPAIIAEIAEFIFSQMRSQISLSAERSCLSSSSEKPATSGRVVLGPDAGAVTAAGAAVPSCGIRITPEKWPVEPYTAGQGLAILHASGRTNAGLGEWRQSRDERLRSAP